MTRIFVTDRNLVMSVYWTTLLIAVFGYFRLSPSNPREKKHSQSGVSLLPEWLATGAFKIVNIKERVQTLVPVFRGPRQIMLHKKRK